MFAFVKLLTQYSMISKPSLASYKRSIYLVRINDVMIDGFFTNVLEAFNFIHDRGAEVGVTLTKNTYKDMLASLKNISLYNVYQPSFKVHVSKLPHISKRYATLFG